MINLSTSGLKVTHLADAVEYKVLPVKLNTTFGTAKAAVNRRSRPLIDLEFESYSKLTFASGQHLFQRTKNEIGIGRCCLNRSRILPIEYVEELE